MKPSFRAYVMAVDRVEQRLRRVTAALDEAGVPYAVIGGNAVAAWVATADPSAVRSTRDVDLLVNRGDVDRVARVMDGLGFKQHDLRRLQVFTDPDEPSRRAGVHLIMADELVRPSYECPAPSVDEAIVADAGFRVLNLTALVRMKLTSMRDIDRVHIADLLSVGLIDQSVRDALPDALLPRLHDIQTSLEDD